MNLRTVGLAALLILPIGYSFPAFSSGCDSIKNPDRRHLCEGNCGLIQNDDLRNLCECECDLIQRDDLQHECEAKCGQ